MKRNLFIIFFMLLGMHINAVTVEIKDGISDPSLKKKIEHNASVLLSEINRAQAQKAKDLDFQHLLRALPVDMQKSLGMLWAVSPFKCTKDNISERLLNSSTGYQIRNIPLLMTPTGKYDENENQEAVINFDRNGSIVSFHLTIAQKQYKKLMENISEYRLNDLENRQIILDYVEQFRTAYNEKDIDFIDQVFSHDALIITGTVIKSSKDGIPLPEKIKYNVKNKQEYLSSLRRVFRINSYIKVNFDDVEVIGHPSLPNYYGVTLHQSYRSSTYSDEGYVFLLWQFPKQGESGYPKIHVRTWQPDQLNGKPLPQEELFNIDMFEGLY